MRTLRPGNGLGETKKPGLPNLGAEKKGPKNFLVSLKRLSKLLLPHLRLVIFAIILGTLGVFFTVFGPKLLGDATNIIFAGTALVPNTGERVGIDFVALARILVLVFGIYVFSAIFSWWQSYLLNIVVQRIVFSLREKISHQLHSLPLKYFDQNMRGDLLSRVTNDVDNISQSVQQTLAQILTSFLTVFGVLFMMFTISPILAGIVFVTVPVSVFVTAKIAKVSGKLFAAQWKNVGEVSAHIEDSFTGYELVKIFGKQTQMQKIFEEKNSSLYKASFGAQFVSGLVMPIIMFIGNLLYVAIAIVGGMLVIGGSLSLGGIQAMVQYSRRFNQPVVQLASIFSVLQSGVASAERVFEFLDEPVFEQKSLAATVPFVSENVVGEVVFDKVCFGYSSQVPLLSDISFVAKPGCTVAIVGETGAGKTTLVNLLMRFYELDAGCITLDGADISRLPLPQFRASFGMVLQESWLFGATVRENIRYGRLGASDMEVVEAAKAAYVDDFICALPEGYDTVLGSDSANISVGQRQLITIARAFLLSAKILILDEATSSVDTRTEMAIAKALRALRSQRTSFVIAHRLSTIRDADLILVMDKGKIVQQGTHEQLLGVGGVYFSLYNSQFSEDV